MGMQYGVWIEEEDNVIMNTYYGIRCEEQMLIVGTRHHVNIIEQASMERKIRDSVLLKRNHQKTCKPHISLKETTKVTSQVEPCYCTQQNSSFN